MKNIYTLIMLIFTSVFLGQTGMGTPTPRGALDINTPTTNRFGLVLPTNSTTANITNPRGGAIAEGTIIYDSQMKCARIFNGTTWSNCLVDATPPNPLTADCSTLGFQGNFNSGETLTGATFMVKVTNNSLNNSGALTFQITDLNLSGVAGISVIRVSATRSSLTPGQSLVVTYELLGTPTTAGTLTANFAKLYMNCSSSVTINKTVRIASFGNFSVGGSSYQAFNSQLKNSLYYGNSGTYNGSFSGFSFVNITSILPTLSTQQLLDKFDIISIRVNNLAVTDVTKIKEFVDRGGVALLFFNNVNDPTTELLNIFGNTGVLTAGVHTAFTSNDNINNGVFGNVTNTLIDGDTATLGIPSKDLPSGSLILAEYLSHAKIFVMGNGGKAICFWDEDLFAKTTFITGNIIDTPEEKILHNIMAYALGKAGF